MSTSQDLVQALKAELKAARLTYADVARHLGMAESSVKRMFARGELTLSRIDAVLQLLHLDFADLARRVADTQPLRGELTLAQEQAVVADPRLLLMAICVLSQWTPEQIVSTYRLDLPQCHAHLVALDRLGVIDWRPPGRYRLKVAKTFRWRPQGPVMRYFREHALADYYSGGFDGEGEMLTLVHGQIGRRHAAAFNERLIRVAQDFAQQHLADQRLPVAERQPYTLLIGMRSWLFAAFRDLMREGVCVPGWPAADDPALRPPPRDAGAPPN